ncbi:MAG: carboxylating nicotinate-nucleotide diphosphorylase [Planctomycetota bacterium]
MKDCYLYLIDKIIVDALNEDIPFGDVTTETLIDNCEVEAKVIANEEGIFCGEVIVKSMVGIVGGINIENLQNDGKKIVPGKEVIRLKGGVKNILKIERTLLNFISLLSGIATITREFTKKLSGTGIILKDTRKTIPNLRVLEKYAVRVGGGKNHRMNLSAFPLVKDNHIGVLLNSDSKKNAVENFIARLKLLAQQTHDNFEIEIQNLKILYLIFKYNIFPHYIMLDNMSLCDIEEAINLIRRYEKCKKRKIFIELSGGINLDNIDEYKNFDVDFISAGIITKKPHFLDFSLEIN